MNRLGGGREVGTHWAGELEMPIICEKKCLLFFRAEFELYLDLQSMPVGGMTTHRERPTNVFRCREICLAVHAP